MKILLLHGYSATNAGDGLLVSESVHLLDEAFPGGTDITVAALHPKTFAERTETVVDASVSRRGYTRELRDLLRSLDDFDLVVGVGGGYLRTGHLLEVAKTVLAHGRQLRAASRAQVPTVYLSQSIGPLRFGTRPLARRILAGLDLIHLRDDRSISEVDLPNTRRTPDLALISGTWAPRLDTAPGELPILTARSVRGKVAAGVPALAAKLGRFDGYVQSTGGGNDDTKVMNELGAVRLMPRSEYLDRSGPRRVVVAVRLHAALMALSAGHFVIHLAYERKGFGAFDDLGLRDYVFNVNDFDVDAIAALTQKLLTDADARRDYDARVAAALLTLAESRAAIIEDLRARVLTTVPE